jgi:bacterioferritin-associated ferredoxin
MVCECNQIGYIDIRKAMVNGARTVSDIMELTGAGTCCSKCLDDIEKILSSACGCNKISLNEVISAVQNGADTLEKLEEVTGAGSPCGKCRKLLQSVIDLKK